MASASIENEAYLKKRLLKEIDNKTFINSRTNSEIEHEYDRNEDNLNNNQQEAENINIAPLKYGANSVIQLFIPVTICIGFVVLLLTSIPYYQTKGVNLPYMPFESDTDDVATKLIGSIANMLIMLTIVIVLTVVLMLLYKYRCYMVIKGWLLFSSVMLLSLFIFFLLYQITCYFDMLVDFVLICYIVWNIAIVGLISIHWKSPLALQQCYLLLVSAIMAVSFVKHLPEWTTWVLLAGISIWDLIAVLTPNGPLSKLVELSQEREEPIFPALIYSTTMVWRVENKQEGDREMQQLNKRSNNNNSIEEEKCEEEDSSKNFKNEKDVVIVSQNKKIDKEDTKKEVSVEENKSMNCDTNRVIPADNPFEVPSTSGFNKGEFNGDNSISGGLSKGLKRRFMGGDAEEQIPTLVAIDHFQTQVINTNQNSDQDVKKKEAKNDDDSGVKLGLGDFIFYSILVGKASLTGDWNTTLACYFGIVVGLSSTLILLSIFRKALPALPISIGFGLVFYFGINFLSRPFYDTLMPLQIYL